MDYIESRIEERLIKVEKTLDEILGRLSQIEFLLLKLPAPDNPIYRVTITDSTGIYSAEDSIELKWDGRTTNHNDLP